MRRALLAAVITLALALAAAAQKQPVFRADVEAVFLDVFVTHGGEPVAGLAAADFELKDNGVRQRPLLVAAESQPVHAALVFDVSDSLTVERLDALRAAGRALLDSLRPADQASLVTFSHEMALASERGADKAGVRSALQTLTAGGATAAFDALFTGVAFAEAEGRALVVMFTDGEDNTSVLDEAQLFRVVERSNALVHVVSGWHPADTSGAPVREPDDVQALRRIAEVSGGRLWAASSPARLRESFAEIAESMRRRYVLRYEPEGVAREGWHRLEVRLPGKKGQVQTRRGYWVAPRAAS